MKFSNLAIVFGPTLMRAPADGLQALMNMPMQSMAVEIMIKVCQRLQDTCVLLAQARAV